LALRLEALTTRIHREGKQKINTLACACWLTGGERWRHGSPFLLFSLSTHWSSQLNWLKSELSAKTSSHPAPKGLMPAAHVFGPGAAAATRFIRSPANHLNKMTLGFRRTLALIKFKP
jgi:hypothetical protein